MRPHVHVLRRAGNHSLILNGLHHDCCLAIDCLDRDPFLLGYYCASVTQNEWMTLLVCERMDGDKRESLGQRAELESELVVIARCRLVLRHHSPALGIAFTASNVGAVAFQEAKEGPTCRKELLRWSVLLSLGGLLNWGLVEELHRCVLARREADQRLALHSELSARVCRVNNRTSR